MPQHGVATGVVMDMAVSTVRRISILAVFLLHGVSLTGTPHTRPPKAVQYEYICVQAETDARASRAAVAPRHCGCPFWLLCRLSWSYSDLGRARGSAFLIRSNATSHTAGRKHIRRRTSLRGGCLRFQVVPDSYIFARIRPSIVTQVSTQAT